MPALKWIGRKIVALLMAALMVAVAFNLIDQWDGSPVTFSRMAEGILTFGFLALYVGGLPALIATGLSDAITPSFGMARRPVALGIHLLGGFLVMFALLGAKWRLASGDWLFVGLSVGAALVFFLVDELIRSRMQPQSFSDR